MNATTSGTASGTASGSATGTDTVHRIATVVAPALMIAVLVVATGMSVNAHNLTVTLPNSDGDTFGFGLAAVVLAAVALGLPILVYTCVVAWRAVRGSAPGGTGALWMVTAWMAVANLAVAFVSRAMVSDTTMYRPGSIDRATEAVMTAGVGGAVVTVAIGVVAALVIRTSDRRSVAV